MASGGASDSAKPSPLATYTFNVLVPKQALIKYLTEDPDKTALYLEMVKEKRAEMVKGQPYKTQLLRSPQRCIAEVWKPIDDDGNAYEVENYVVFGKQNANFEEIKSSPSLSYLMEWSFAAVTASETQVTRMMYKYEDHTGVVDRLWNSICCSDGDALSQLLAKLPVENTRIIQNFPKEFEKNPEDAQLTEIEDCGEFHPLKALKCA
mmetsp:Transcript_87437/g.155073  ORF Transcript_87437/g.155073 Transcript_87437/m.155073 type:complete len:207 (-) Transcript_87437:58-678(-)